MALVHFPPFWVSVSSLGFWGFALLLYLHNGLNCEQMRAWGAVAVGPMFALTLRRNSRRDQVELNARDTFTCTINIQFRAFSYDAAAENL